MALSARAFNLLKFALCTSVARGSQRFRAILDRYGTLQVLYVSLLCDLISVFITGVKQEVVDEVTSQTAAVVRLRDRNTTSAVPAAFRRSDITCIIIMC